LYAAEDALHIVRQRLEGITAAAELALEALDLHVITAPTLRLDLPSDRERLAQTVQALKPRLLVLDPFVRLHRIDENASGEVAPLLAYLRELQRRYSLAVLLVHHAKKGGSKIRAGQALRGSSEFHAWGDSNLYLRRAETDLTLTIEHRAAPSLTPIALELTEQGKALALQVRAGTAGTKSPAPPSPLDERIKQALQEAGGTLPLSDLRERCRVRNATLHERLRALTRSGLLLRDAEGYRLIRSNGAHS
jgi:RecA-family ATPase